MIAIYGSPRVRALCANGAFVLKAKDLVVEVLAVDYSALRIPSIADHTVVSDGWNPQRPVVYGEHFNCKILGFQHKCTMCVEDYFLQREAFRRQKGKGRSAR